MRMNLHCLQGARIAAGLLLLFASSTRPADAKDRVMVPIEEPATTAYHFSSRPMIAGTVASVNDHQLVIDTEQGERVTLRMDSRTMAPKDLAPGMEVRADFHALENCRFHAQRVTVLREGMPGERFQGYAISTDDAASMARNAEYRRHHGSYDRVIDESSPKTSIRAYPATAAYRAATTPMVSGMVMAVNDHRMVVESEQGLQINLVMDSRTMVPGQVQTGSLVRAEFKEMKDGRYYATRVHRVEESDLAREQAYARTRDAEFQLAAQNDPCAPEFAAPSGTTLSSYEQQDGTNADAMSATSDADRADGAQGSGAMTSSDEPGDGTGGMGAEGRDPGPMPETLPQTDSRQSLMLALGLLALASAGVVRMLRGPRKV
jgi:LPXTG-motif cell wall-anchored protein